MVRPPRDEGPGAIHHVVAQGSGRGRIVEEDRDRLAYDVRFARIRRELGWLALSSCLMDTHHHAIIQTAEPNLGLGMQRLQGGHSRWFNQRHRREGPVFRHRYWSRRIDDDAWLLRACIYVVVNPVAAGLCDHPRDWRWSSYTITAEGYADVYAPGEEQLLRMFGSTPGEARRRYLEVIDDAVKIVIERRLANGSEVWAALDHLDAFPLARVPG